MTRDEARGCWSSRSRAEATHDAAVKLREINQRVRDKANRPRARSFPPPSSAARPIMFQAAVSVVRSTTR